MQADQAAGLRNRQPRADVRVITSINTPTDVALRLGQALLASEQKVLLIDSLGRHTHTRNTHFLFGWQQQLAQQRLHTWSIAGVDVLHAPGAQAGDAAIVQASANYHAVIFDGYTLQHELALAPHSQQLVVALDAQAHTLMHAYALIKTLHQHKFEWRVILVGEAALAERLIAAVTYFLPAQAGWVEYMNLDIDAHFRALAARISAADGARHPSQNNTGESCAQHG